MALWTPDSTVEIGAEVTEGNTLPATVYTDESVLEREQERIFQNSWQYVGSANAVTEPGEYFTASVAGRGLFVIRGDDGDLRAFYNVCPHRGSRMLAGSGQTNRIMCPYHNWTFETDGSFATAPAAFSNTVRNPELADCDVEGPGGECDSLEEIHVQTLGAFVFVNFGEEPVPFDDFVGEIPAALAAKDLGAVEHDRRLRRDLDCNWKVMVSNYLECDHCHSNHPDFVNAVNMEEYTVELEEYYSVQYGPLEEDGEVVGETRFYFLWPNTTINIYQSGGGVAAYRIEPTGTGTTELVADYYFPEDQPTAKRDEIVDTSLTLQKEDFELVERQHDGLSSGAIVQGRFGPNEHAVHHFHQLVAGSLGLEV